MKLKIGILSIVSVLIVFFSLDIGMFWDNVLFASKMGTAVYENSFFNWHIPIEFDPGHPPFLATVMAIGWTLFGKSLAVSHWLMLPFIFGFLWQIHLFVSYFIKEIWLQIFAFILVVADPTLLSQFVLVNPEIIQLFFFFLALNAVLKNNTYLKVLGLLFLGIVTYRGMMLCFGIFLIELFICLYIKKGTLKSFFSRKMITTYFLGAIPALIFIGWRFFTFGWFQTHPDSPWVSLWHFVSIKEFLFNLVVLTQRYIDFGRITILFVIMIGLFIKRKAINKEIGTLIIISIFSTITIIAVSLTSTNSMGHRYFITSYLAFALLSFVIIQSFKFKKAIYVGLLASLILGNFIVYSDDFSQGWDASLAHLNYWGLRKHTLEYMDDKKIPISKTASFFPNATAIDNVDLNGDMRSFKNFTGEEEYVFYSNVFNVTDEELKLLDQKYYSIKTIKKNGVKIELKRRLKNK